ncbi:MAG: alanine dehydrogenase [Mariprofundaceae bacterium]|nr:alanine dehydrogenase [Mariprofundaceae bacterium]
MIIGVPRELKNRERRVALTPDGAAQLVAAGHVLRIEQNAGKGSGFSDADYATAGAQVLAKDAVWEADLVVKVKEPLPEEYGFLRPQMFLFTYLHLAAEPQLVDVLLANKVRAIAYETVQTDNGALPLLAPMSRIAGRVAAQIGAHLLQAENGTPFVGKGVLMGGEPPANVIIIGGGHAGRAAASVACGMGAAVRIFDVSAACVADLNKTFVKKMPGERCAARFFDMNACTVDEWAVALNDCDLLIGAALIVGEHAPQLLEARHLARMAGGVFVDISIDQGGMSASSRPTSYAEPVYVEAGVLHCCLPNLPAAVPVSATHALTVATLPWLQKLAGTGITAAMCDTALARGVNTWDGQLVHRGVAHALGIPFTSLEALIVD